MTAKIFDSHAHYDDEKFDEDRDKILNELLSSNIGYIINCGSDTDTSLSSVRLSEKFENIFAAVGIHPHESEKCLSNIDNIEEFLQNKKVVAVGEIGLDYHYDLSPRDIQKQVFKKQLEIANEYKYPVIIHSREATLDTLNILKEYTPSGVVHCFSGSRETAEQILNLGMFFGIGGAVTFKNAVKLIEALKVIPIDKILLETDCPYMTPVPYRGKRNDSSYIKYTALKISEIKNISYEEVIEKTSENAKQLFKIK